MPLHMERIDWMPSPPLAPDDGPLDIEHLEQATLGDLDLQREVLGMFVEQAARLAAALAARPANAEALAHTLKGSARGIGAFRVADLADALESVIRGGGDASQAYADLREAMAETRAAIEAILRRT